MRGGVHQPDPELAAGPQQPRIDERRPVIDIRAGGHAAGGQRRFQRGGQANGVLGEPEPVTGREAAMIIEEGEQAGLTAPGPRAVQRVTDPAIVRHPGLKPAGHHPAAGGRAISSRRWNRRSRAGLISRSRNVFG